MNEQETPVELTDEHLDMVAGGYGGAEGDQTCIKNAGKGGGDWWF